MDTSNVKMRYVFAAIIAVFPMVGLICSLVYHNISMLWFSLIGAVVAAIVFPIALVLLFIMGQLFIQGIMALMTLISEVAHFRKR